jgi:hypothetical protein
MLQLKMSVFIEINSFSFMLQEQGKIKPQLQCLNEIYPLKQYVPISKEICYDKLLFQSVLYSSIICCFTVFRNNSIHFEGLISKRIVPFSV